MSEIVGLYGGSFDPIHRGHVDVGYQLIKKLPFTRLEFIPCGTPPHRPPPIASAEDRLKMVQIAIEGTPQFRANDLEVKRSGPSYTIDTVKAFQQTLDDSSRCLIIATDAMNTFNQWHEWESILDYCHIFIVTRWGYNLTEEKWLKQLLKTHKTSSFSDLVSTRSGLIYIQTMTSSAISATYIREQLFKGAYDTIADLLPPNVLEYIKRNKLYSNEHE